MQYTLLVPILREKGIDMISIIIPVYNSEKFLHKCVNSVLHQTFQNWELILVDDGSSDSSRRICDMCAQNNPQVRTIHKENGGVSSARNAGLDVAIGEYIMFVDSDDWLEPELCQELVDGIRQSDIVIGGYKAFFAKGQVEHVAKENKIQFPEEFPTISVQLYENNLLNAPVSKLYRRSLIGIQRFDENTRLGEDFLFNLEYLPKCRYISTVSSSGYVYNVLNENSATKNFRQDDFSQIVYLYKMGKTFAEQYGFWGETCSSMKKQFFLNGVNLLQLLFYSDYKQDKKVRLAMEILANSAFKEVCSADFPLPLKYAIPRKLCKANNFTGLKYFFWAKKFLTKFIKG